ncbi:hypothetical protein [Microbacterium sp. KNMS]
MSADDNTPTPDFARTAYWNGSGRSPEEFDRMLDAEREKARQEERERCARIADSFAIEVNNRAISDDLAAWASAMGKYRGAQEVAARIREGEP